MAMPTAKFEKLESGVGVESPCIGICTLIPESKICRGCFRTSDEIAEWMLLSDSEKQQVIEKSTRRGEYQGHGDFPSF
jgi:predicted Fe-S protein YdhL (DUF1289 family)